MVKVLGAEGLSIEEVLQAYDWKGQVEKVCRYGAGHINDTFEVTAQNPQEGPLDYILQRINKSIFKIPEQVMENIVGVTDFLREKIVERGGDPERETLTVYRTKNGQNCYKDSQGEYWRVYLFIEDAICLQSVEEPQQFFESARSFGNFMNQLGEYPAAALHETIPDFHNTPVRYENLMKAAEKDVMGRVASVEKELEFVRQRKEDCFYLVRLLEQGKLPLRVTHNDTKLNNILLDSKTQKGICIIDLDTIMPGLAAYDFGDSIRFGAATAAEDEPDLSKVHFDPSLYQTYLEGYLQGAGDVLTRQEIDSLPWGARLMTLECGMRFLTDYLEGDHYFKISRPGHNLDRMRTQLKLVWEMEQYFK